MNYTLSTPTVQKSRMKPKTNRGGDPAKSHKFDCCQTPFYALDPLIPYLNKDWLIWEPAAGDGHIVQKLTAEGFSIFGTDILAGQNFFDHEPDKWDCLVTNPPYSIKYDWLKRCYDLGRPVALLLPVDTLAAKAAQKVFSKVDLELVLPERRANFKMPEKGYKGQAQFSTLWFTWGLNIGKSFNWLAPMTRYPDEQPALFQPTIYTNLPQRSAQ